ncbi:MAG TPA: hypothetical protein VGB22_02090 [candidate division Zixibacteria bacterium]
MAAVILVFGAVTIITMLAMTFALIHGLSLIPVRSFERWVSALAEFALFVSGAPIRWLGL